MKLSQFKMEKAPMENKQENSPAISAPDPSDQTPGGKRKWAIVLVCLAVVAAGALVAFVLVASAPKAKRRPPAKITPLVRVQKVYPQPQTVVIQAMGTVVPARELNFKSRVAGEIVSLHPEFTQGGIVHQGETLAQIDPVDYRLLVAQKQSAVADASYNLKLELGRQEVARREWTLLNGDNATQEADAELALRKPHLEKARSELVAAEAELAAAKLQLARTQIKAPFNAVVRDTHVERGSQVAAQESLATLAGVDQYWVKVAVPVHRLPWVAIPGNHAQIGAPVEVTYQGGATRKGRVVKLLSDLESEGRMARLIIAVEDPLGLKAPDASKPALLIGEYVRVAIQGRQIESAYRIPREALRDNTHVWVADQQNKLAIRSVETLWRDTRTVLLQQGLQPGDRVIVSDLATPVDGMDLQVENKDAESIKPASVSPETLKQD